MLVAPEPVSILALEAALAVVEEFRVEQTVEGTVRQEELAASAAEEGQEAGTLGVVVVADLAAGVVALVDSLVLLVQGGFSAGSGSSGGGNGGGGGAGLGATIFVDTGTLTLVDSIISGSHAIGGSGGPLAQNGYGVLGSIFNLGGTIHVQNTGLSLTTTNTTFQHWTNANLIYRVPKGTPKVFINDELAIEDVVTRTPVQVALQNGFSAGTMVYSLTGTDPRFHSTLYTGPFTVNRSALLRVLSYDSNFAASVEIDSIQITVLPTLNATTAGGGTISVQPVSGPYISNRFAQVVAQPCSGLHLPTMARRR